MAPKPGPGSGNPPVTSPPTGNALTDAQGAAVAAASQQAVNALIGIGQTVAQPQGSECLWPPPATWGLGFGILRFSLGVPCLITKSEARALIGAGVLASGILIIGWGISIFVVAEALPPILAIAGIRMGPARNLAPSKLGPPAPKKEEQKEPSKEDVTEAA